MGTVKCPRSGEVQGWIFEIKISVPSHLKKRFREKKLASWSVLMKIKNNHKMNRKLGYNRWEKLQVISSSNFIVGFLIVSPSSAGQIKFFREPDVAPGPHILVTTGL